MNYNSLVFEEKDMERDKCENKRLLRFQRRVKEKHISFIKKEDGAILLARNLINSKDQIDVS